MPIMTKLDKHFISKDEQLPIAFNDGVALRGFVNSTLESSVVLSAGNEPKIIQLFESFSASSGCE
jgi:hypothetical protein